MMNSAYEFIEVSLHEYMSETKDGEQLINNKFCAIIYDDHIMWDVNVANVHGRDIKDITEIMKQTEIEEGIS